MQTDSRPRPRFIPQYSIQFLLLITTCVAVASALGRTLHTPKTHFRAECTVHVGPSTTTSASDPSANAIASQLTSHEVLCSVSRRREIAGVFGTHPDVVKHLAQGLAVEQSGERYCIAYQYHDVDVAVDVVEAVIEEFVRLNNCQIGRRGMLIRVVST